MHSEELSYWFRLKVRSHMSLWWNLLDHGRCISISGLTPENASVTDESVFSDGDAVRQHKKGLSLSDLSSFTQASKLWRNENSEKSSNKDSNGHDGGVITTKAIVLDKGEEVTTFYSRCHSTNPFHCKLPSYAKNLIEDEEKPITFLPGDNYLVMETVVSKLY